VSYSGWQLLLAECGQLATQLSAGGVVSNTAAVRVGLAARLVAAVVASCPDMARRLEQLTHQLFIIVHKAECSYMG
jgi:hypothetical protein